MNKPGISLVELLIAIAIIGILAVAAIQAGTTTQRYLIFSNAYEDIVHTVQRARSLALSRQTRADAIVSYGIFFERTGATTTMTLFADANNNRRYDRPAPATPGEEIESPKTINARFLLSIRTDGTCRTTATMLFNQKGEVTFQADGVAIGINAMRLQLNEIGSNRSRGFGIDRVTRIVQHLDTAGAICR